MTVQELLDVSPFCDLIEVVVRKGGHGQWIQGYRVGKNAKIYPAEITAEIREMKELKTYVNPTICLKEGEIIDTKRINQLPMKIICKDCHNLPDNVGNLEVCCVQPRHIPHFHKDALTHNEYILNVDCYLDNYVLEKKIEAKTEEISGQIDIFGYLESEG